MTGARCGQDIECPATETTMRQPATVPTETPSPQAGDERLTRHFAWLPQFIFTKGGGYRTVWLRHYQILEVWHTRGSRLGWVPHRYEEDGLALRGRG